MILHQYINVNYPINESIDTEKNLIFGHFSRSVCAV